MFLVPLEKRLPFPLKALQVDGGSEFEALFEEECRRRDIRLFVLPPRSPKLNGCVERAHRTHTEEFYEVENFPLDIVGLPPARALCGGQATRRYGPGSTLITPFAPTRPWAISPLLSFR